MTSEREAAIRAHLDELRGLHSLPGVQPLLSEAMLAEVLAELDRVRAERDRPQSIPVRVSGGHVRPVYPVDPADYE
jgi:hypothetical protein